MAARKPTAGSQSSAAALEELARILTLARSSVVVAIAALREQNCELDADVAVLLQRTVADRLFDALERIEALRVAARGASGPRGRTAAQTPRSRRPKAGR